MLIISRDCLLRLIPYQSDFIGDLWHPDVLYFISIFNTLSYQHSL